MNTTRTGKIARLPHHIRDQLNRRFHEGEQAKYLATWLNSLPEVQAILAAGFGGKSIRPQNLSEWKQGGYRDWLLHQEALALARHVAEGMAQVHVTLPPLEEKEGKRRQSHPALPSTLPLPAEESASQTPRSTLHGPLTDTLALWLAARYALATRTFAAEGAERWRRLRELCADVVELRRGDHAAERLRLDRLRFAHRFHHRQT